VLTTVSGAVISGLPKRDKRDGVPRIGTVLAEARRASRRHFAGSASQSPRRALEGNVGIARAQRAALPQGAANFSLAIRDRWRQRGPGVLTRRSPVSFLLSHSAPRRVP